MYPEPVEFSPRPIYVRSILILSSGLCLGTQVFCFLKGFHFKMYEFLISHAFYIFRSSQKPWFYDFNNIWGREKLWNAHYGVFSILLLLPYSHVQISLSVLCSWILSVYFTLGRATKFHTHIKQKKHFHLRWDFRFCRRRLWMWVSYRMLRSCSLVEIDRRFRGA
jgi:hypothetical protein